MDHSEFQRRLNAGALGDMFGYELEIDAMRWDDLLAERKHYLPQLAALKG